MKIKDVMTDPAIVVSEDTTIEETAKVMRRYNIGSLPVVNDRDELCGMITDRDIVIRNIARGMDAKIHKVGEIMSRNVVVTTPETDTVNTTVIMSRDKVRRLPVLDKNRVVGVVALGDLAVCNNLMYETGKTLCEISEGCCSGFPQTH